MYFLQTLLIFVTFYKHVLACGSYSFDYEIRGQIGFIKKISDVEEISECGNDNQSVFVDQHYILELCCKIFACKNILDAVTFNNCFIRKFEENCFSNSVLNVRSVIRVTRNHITTIKKHTFRDLVVMQIDLSNNFIEKLEDEAFLNLNNLLILHLGGNLLTVINPKAFALIPRLESLSLYENRIRTLQPGFFSFLSARNSDVNLACNEISQLKKSAFDGLSSRVILDLTLNGNKIEILPEDIFTNRSWQSVDLSYNPLKTISRHFCDKQCVMQIFEFDCVFLTWEDVEFIVDWAEAKEVDLYGGGCLQYNVTVMLPTKLCGGATNFEDFFSWKFYASFYLLLLNYI
ncbi:hypothetical protein Zmor_022512 [Zophobas morio]|uniref:Uncharacterized protein n=1 Tax=Zophobas morio TaxID=2755281 RepID=A0AA38HWQ8_9CUCU|nr:hypothetical protein Zmor_022512 [Zophobas morio]